MKAGPAIVPAWERHGDHLVASVEVAAEHLALATDYALHRLRAWRARRRGVLHPVSVLVDRRSLALSFPVGALAEPSEALLPFERWRDDVLLPALHVLVSSLENGIVGFAPLRPIDGRWVPPVSFFLPRPPSESQDRAVGVDLRLAHAWMLDQRERSEPPRHPADRRLFDSLANVLGKGDLPDLMKLLKEDRDDAARRRRLDPPAPSFLALLTEAELLERVGNVFRYNLLERDEARRLGLPSGGRARVLEVDTKWRDPHFPPMNRPSPQELWDTLTDETKTTPVFAVFRRLPNPLRKAGNATPRARWVDVHIDQPYLTVIPDGAGLPKSGWLMLDNAGDNTLMLRKRDFTAFAGAHPGLTDVLAEPPPPNPFEHNPQPRDALEEVILGHHGVFPVQGPPGTGKTYLATQVVRRFLARNPGGRVLVCAKEHFALDHILRKIVEALQEDGVPCRPWRSVSQSRLRRARGETDTRWLAPAVTRDLAARSWTAESAEWAQWQASTSEAHDRRLATLGQQSANLFFCTTMDAAMVGFLDAESFDLVIVEEAGKCYPSELLHAVCLGRTSLLIGDHMQLPPYQERRTREAVEAWAKTLGRAVHRQEHRAEMQARFGATFQALYALAEARGPLTLEEQAWIRPFEFLFDRLPARHRIEEQFRMEAPLSRVIGEVFYGKPFIHRKGELVAAGALPERPLGDVVPEELDVPLVWLDTPHMLDVPEATEDPAKRGVRDNQYELDVVLAYLRQLRPAEPIDMVILTPYNAQKSLMLDSGELRTVCEALTDIPFERVVRTTDEYQGREAELTVLSLVRNNSLGARAWGFMTEKERLNVMFSRTRFRQVVVGCSDHIERHAEEASWLHGVWRAYQRQAQDPACATIRDAREVLRG